METAATAAVLTVVGLFFGEAVKEAGKNLGKVASEKAAQLISLVRDKFRNTGMEGVLTRAEQEPTEKNIARFADELTEHLKEPAFAKQLHNLTVGLEQEGLTQEVLKGARIGGNLKVGDVVQRRQPGAAGKQSIAENLNVQGDAQFGNLTQEG
jgi:hypothetical protein